jgi:hypothetical protein
MNLPPAFSSHPREHRRDDVPDAPPPEVLDEIAAAAEAHERLVADGRQVHFGIGAFTRRLSAEIRDEDGELLESLTPRRVLELACGPLTPF